MIKLINTIVIFIGALTCSVSWADDNVSTVQDQPINVPYSLIEGPSGVSRQLEEEENAYEGRPDMSPIQSLTDWKAQLKDKYGLSMGAYAILLYQYAEEILPENEHSAAGTVPW